ncbi:MAG: nucleotide sugar dehydrogenase [Azovibrio sp.]|nr:nucleotide sugar dehydrogenase [Azovibrio sp.]
MARSTLPTIAVIGLGYVGLPLVVAFGKQFPTIGFDIASHKVLACQTGRDPAKEISPEEMAEAIHARYTDSPNELATADFIIIAVPTPVDRAHIPDFTALIGASDQAGRHMKRGATIIYESTVYPGATEEICIPTLERSSGMRWKRDFFVAYSPERINPGDREHTLTNVLKVVAGDTRETLEKVSSLYRSIVKAGIHTCSSIKVAEAAKVIENTQRDLNIALMNELALIFNRLGIDTQEVLTAAGTKWNFLKFKPGLVGGHCIGVDPYYLTHKAQSIGYHPEVILAGRRINDGMGKYIAEQTIKQMISSGSPIKGAQVNVLGITFKENCADIRNTKVIDIIQELRSYGVCVHVHDPVADPKEVQEEFGIDLKHWENLPIADALIIAVAHREFTGCSCAKLLAKLTPNGCIIDVKGIIDPLDPALQSTHALHWRL